MASEGAAHAGAEHEERDGNAAAHGRSREGEVENGVGGGSPMVTGAALTLPGGLQDANPVLGAAEEQRVVEAGHDVSPHLHNPTTPSITAQQHERHTHKQFRALTIRSTKWKAGARKRCNAPAAHERGHELEAIMRTSAILSIIFSLVMLPVMRYRNDSRS